VEEKTDFPQAPHVHDYSGRTSVDMGHFHNFSGATMVSQTAVGGHVHGYAGETLPAENHTHIMRGTSGLPISVLLGHVHQMAGVTEVTNNHTHSYDLYTGYQRAPRNVRRPRLVKFLSSEENQEAPEVRRPRFRFHFGRKEVEPTPPSSDEK